MSARQVRVRIHRNGDVEVIDNSAAAPLLTGLRGRRRRISRIYPSGALKRQAFFLLRAVFGDGGSVAGWTRTWKGPWTLDMRLGGGPVVRSFGPWSRFSSHADAVSCEVVWFGLNGWRSSK